MTTSAIEPWVETILSARDPDTAWSDIFDRLRDVALATSNPQTLHKQTVDPDRLLAESAWSLWQDFPSHAPKVIDELKRFWTSGSASGTAILILDALSLRELPLIVGAAKKRGVTPVRIEVRGSEVPTETDQFALSFLRPVDYYRGNPETLLAERRRKLQAARELRKQENIKLRQRLLPFVEDQTVSYSEAEIVSL